MAKILIVDDEPRIRDLIREHLQYAGFTCEEAGDGTAALSVLSQGGIRFIHEFGGRYLYHTQMRPRKLQPRV